MATLHGEISPPTEATPSVEELRLLCDMKDNHNFDNLEKISREAFEAFLEEGSAASLVAAREFLDLALRCLTEGDEDRRWQLLRRKWAIQQWSFEMTGARHYIAIVLSDASKTLDGLPTGSKTRRAVWISLGRTLLLKYEIDGTFQDLDNALSCFQSAESVHDLSHGEADFPQGDSGFETVLDDSLVNSDTRAQIRLKMAMAECLDLQAERNGTIETSWEGLLRAEEAYNATSAHKALRIDAAACLASRYFARAPNSGGVWLETAIDLMEEALDLCPSIRPCFPGLVSTFSSMILMKYTKNRQDNNKNRSAFERQDIDRGVWMAKEAIAKASPNSNARIKLLDSLISLLRMRYEDTHQPDDLAHALNYAHELHHRTCWSEQHIFFRKTRLKALIKLEELCVLKGRESLSDPTLELLMHFARKEIPRLQKSISDWEIRSKEPDNLRESQHNVWIALDDGDLSIARAMGVEAAQAMLGAELPGLQNIEDNEGTPHHLANLIFNPRFNTSHPFSPTARPESAVASDLNGTTVMDVPRLEEKLLQIEDEMAELRNNAKTGSIGFDYPDGYVLSPYLNLSLFFLQEQCAKSDTVFDRVCAWLKYHAPLKGAEKPQSPDRMQTLQFLGRMYRSRYDARENLGDLDNAIEIWSAILDSTSGPFDSYRCDALYHLAHDLQTRFLVLGNVDDLRRALAAGEEGITMSTPLGELRDEQWGLLGSLYVLRFEHYTRIADLNRATSLLGELVLKQHKHNNLRYRTLLDLGKAFGLKFSHGYRGTSLDLEFSRVANQMALTASSVPRWGAVINIASSAIAKFDMTDDRYYLDKAIKILELANKFCDQKPEKQAVEICLSGVLNTRYLIDHNINDQNRALQLTWQLVVTSKNDRSYREEALRQYGEVSQSCAPEESSAWSRLKSFPKSCEVLEKVMSTNTTPVLERIGAARKLARMYWQTGAKEKTHSCLQDAVDLMLLLSPRWIEDLDRQFVLSLVDGLVEDAAAVALSVGQDASEALRLLEKGRGVILGSVLDGRNDISGLRALHADLYSTFEDLRDRLFRSDWSNVEELVSLKTETSTSSKEQLEQLASQYEAALREIRSIDRFKDFQLPPDAEKMRTLAGDGYIVVIFHSKLLEESSAIIISQAGFYRIKLILTSHLIIRLEILVRVCAEAELQNVAQMGTIMDRALDSLWSWIVKPVLDRIETLSEDLGTKGGQQALPCIRWIACGALSALPLHAARPFGGQGCMHKTISSYVPTLRAMQFASDGDPCFVNRGSARVAIYYMDETPGQCDLDNAEEEANAIVDHLKPIVKNVTKAHQPNAACVLQAIDKFDIVHFACHGESDPNDPSRSCLVFVKKKQARNPESKYAYVHADRLTVRDIIENTSHSTCRKSGRLVFLSGCSTADNPASKLGNECIHLAAAFHLAGFSHAIGTMWDSTDTACALVASEFYQALFPSGTHGQGEAGEPSKRVASAYRQAVLALMEDRKNPIHWAPFVHYGP